MKMKKVMRELLVTASYSTQAAYMFGDARRKIPVWTGYDIGFNILNTFVSQHPTVSIEAWTAMSAQEIFESSGYEGQTP
ncbi:MAG: DUF2268 domain-containing putative Zn-dependent protease [Chloroflexota bacterium]